MNNIGYNGLPKDWVLIPSLDAELKLYTLLAYLQRVERRFHENKLFPYVGDLRSHIADLVDLRESKNALMKTLNGELVGFDSRTGAPVHGLLPEPDLMNVIDEVVDFAIPGMERLKIIGEEKQGSFIEKVQLITVGIQPLYATEGWLLLRAGKQARAYNYSIPLVQNTRSDAEHTNIRTNYVTSYTMGIGFDYHHAKADLVHRYTQFPNPATFAVETELPLPYMETLLPLAKRCVIDHLGSAK